MRFYTKSECEEWLRDRNRLKPDLAPGIQRERLGYPKERTVFFIWLIGLRNL
jgi:hypothetical protein